MNYQRIMIAERHRAVERGTMLEEPEESNASRSTRSSKRAWPNSEEQLRRDPQSFSPLPRERAVLQGEGLAKSAEIGRPLAHFGRPAEAAIEHSQSHGALAFMATDHGTGSRRGGFFVCDPMAEPRTAGSGGPRRTVAGSRWGVCASQFLCSSY